MGRLGGGTQLTLSEPSAGREATVARSLLAAVTLARPSEMVPLSISCAFSTWADRPPCYSKNIHWDWVLTRSLTIQRQYLSYMMYSNTYVYTHSLYVWSQHAGQRGASTGQGSHISLHQVANALFLVEQTLPAVQADLRATGHHLPCSGRNTHTHTHIIQHPRSTYVLETQH